MKIARFIFNNFGVNTYVVYSNGEAIIIDPGNYSTEETNVLIDFIVSNSLEVKVLVATHLHVDHILGVGELKDKFDCEFWASEKDLYLLETFEQTAKIFGFKNVSQPKVDKFLYEGEFLEAGNIKMKIICVPGHTLGHLAFVDNNKKFAIVGDVIFRDTIGRTDLDGGDLDTLLNSIHSKILTLPDDTKLFPGHGEATTVSRERISNMFL